MDNLMNSSQIQTFILKDKLGYGTFLLDFVNNMMK